jgi:hypothetical protein
MKWIQLFLAIFVGAIVGLMINIKFRQMWIRIFRQQRPTLFDEYEQRLTQDRDRRTMYHWVSRLALGPFFEEFVFRGIPVLFVMILPPQMAAYLFEFIVWIFCSWVWGLSHVWTVESRKWYLHVQVVEEWQQPDLRKLRVIAFIFESAFYTIAWFLAMDLAPASPLISLPFPFRWPWIIGGFVAVLTHTVHNFGISTPRRFGIMYRGCRRVDTRIPDPSQTPTPQPHQDNHHS